MKRPASFPELSRPELSRHARLFELIRQETVVKGLRQQMNDAKPQEAIVDPAFRRMAEKSLQQVRFVM